MTTVADLGVNVWAQSASFTSEMERIRESGQKTFTGLAGEVEGFAHKMHESLGVIRQFRPILELGFGVEIGRQAFEKLHESIAKGVEGFTEAQNAGLGFFQSLEDGVKSVVHLKTAVEELREAEKRHVEATKDNEEGQDFIAKLNHQRRHNRFPGLSEHEENDVMKDYNKYRDEARTQHTDAKGDADFRKLMNTADQLYQAAIRESTRRVAARLADIKNKQDQKDDRIQKEIQDAAQKQLNYWQNWIKDRVAGKKEEKPFSLATSPQNFPGGQHAWDGMSDYQKSQALANKGINDKRHEDIENSLNAAAQQFIKAAETALQKARDQMAQLNAVRDRLRPDVYNDAKNKILEDYAKTKERSSSRDIGGAEDYNSAAGYKAVEDSRNALAGLQDKQTELLEAQNDLQGQAVTQLQNIATSVAGGFNLDQVDSFQ
jgi:hypothetical protein